MDSFFGRDRELDVLQNMYDSDKFEFAVIYGRRRVGKTTLISRFCKGKPAVFFAAAQSTAKDNLGRFSKAVFSQSAHESENAPVFHDFDSLLSYFDSYSGSRKQILVIDEYPYLAESESSMSSLLQIHIDHSWRKKSNLMLILCGSSMSFMEHQVLGYQSPIYGRRTSQLKIRPFDFFETGKMCAWLTDAQQVALYGLTGGVPEYLRQFQKNRSFDENVRELFFRESGVLYGEPGSLLLQELRDPSTYNSMISSIAHGASKMNEIATKTGITTGLAGNLLHTLIELEIVKKEVPVTEQERSRRTIYRVDDALFRFWHRFVAPNQSLIAQGAGDMVYEEIVKPEMDHFLGQTFEDICRQYLTHPYVMKGKNFFYTKIGRWWGTNPKTRKQEEIDIVALHKQNTLLCECKWNRKKTDRTVLDALAGKAELFPGSVRLCLFSRSGFTKDCTQSAAERGGVTLLTLEDICRLK